MTNEKNPDKLTIWSPNHEEFLRELEARIVQGYRIESIPLSFGLGEFSIVLYLKTPWVRPKRNTDGLPDRGPYTVEQMKRMSLPDLRDRANREYELTDRGKHGLMKKILKHYEQEKLDATN